jgi:hypothetical protein
MIITSRWVDRWVAQSLQLKMISYSTVNGPNGPRCTVQWDVPDGLLRQISVSGNAESGWTYIFEVTSGAIENLKLLWHTGSANSQPTLRWTD